MKLKFDGCDVSIAPESDAERLELARIFGRVRHTANGRGEREFDGPAYGLGVFMKNNDETVYVKVADAWWNYDDRDD